MLFIIGALFCVALAQEYLEPITNDNERDLDKTPYDGSSEESDMVGAESKWKHGRRGGHKYGGWRGWEWVVLCVYFFESK